MKKGKERFALYQKVLCQIIDSETLLERESMWCWPVCFKMLQALAGIVRCGHLLNIPHRHMWAFHPLEPLAAPPKHINVVAGIGKLKKSLNICPHGHVHDDVIVFIGANRCGIPIVRFQPLDEPWRTLGQRINRV